MRLASRTVVHGPRSKAQIASNACQQSQTGRLVPSYSPFGSEGAEIVAGGYLGFSPSRYGSWVNPIPLNRTLRLAKGPWFMVP